MTPEEFFGALANMPAATAPVFKLYHDENGHVLFYSMEDLPGTWIEIDAATYAAAPHDVRIIDGKAVRMPKTVMVHKLKPADRGVCCDPRDICIVVGQDQPHVKWSLNGV